MKCSLAREFYYRVKLGDTIKNICDRYNTSNENITRNNPNISLYPGEWVKIKVNDYITHIVRPMETLDYISKKYNIPILRIKDTNNLDSDKLYIGQILKIQ